MERKFSWDVGFSQLVDEITFPTYNIFILYTKNLLLQARACQIVLNFRERDAVDQYK